MDTTHLQTDKRNKKMTYPTFRKRGFGLYKIISKDTYIEVYQPCEFYRGDVKIETNQSWVQKVLFEGAHITENQFIDAYVRAIHDIQMEVYPQGMPVINEPAY